MRGGHLLNKHPDIKVDGGDTQWSEHYNSNLEIYNVLHRLDLLSCMLKLARLDGIQFAEGTQNKVGSSKLRLAKPNNYAPVSHSMAGSSWPDRQLWSSLLSSWSLGLVCARIW